jgi:hypothetical protein
MGNPGAGQMTNRGPVVVSPQTTRLKPRGTRCGEILVKGVKDTQSTQVIAAMGNIKFGKCPLYP